MNRSRSKDVRRIYHRETKATINGDKSRAPMKAWARRFIKSQRPGDGDLELLNRISTVVNWLSDKGVRA